jgi:hypothetical protein
MNPGMEIRFDTTRTHKLKMPTAIERRLSDILAHFKGNTNNLGKWPLSPLPMLAHADVDRTLPDDRGGKVALCARCAATSKRRARL